MYISDDEKRIFPDKKNPENTRVKSKVSPPVTINEYNASFKAIALYNKKN